MALAPERQRLVVLMASTVDDQARHRNWRYRAVRPQAILPSYIPGGYIEADCSDGCRDLCRWANIPDPAGNVYAPYGNSSSIWAHLPHISLSEAEPGDIVVFGYRYGEHHACMLWERPAAALTTGTSGITEPQASRRRGLSFKKCSHTPAWR